MTRALAIEPNTLPRLKAADVAVVAAILIGLSVGCASWPGTPSNIGSGSASTSNNDQKSVSPTELRFRLQRFADSLAEAFAQPLDELLSNEPDIAKRKLILEAKYAYTSNAILIASDAYPSVSLLDMIVFVSLLRASIEGEGPQLLGDSIGRILQVARKYEREVWNLADILLTTLQQQELRGLIDRWFARNADRGYSEAIRFGEFASELDREDSRKAHGLLSQIRHATATADHALELAERLTYFFQRAPPIWRMQAQLGYFEIMSQLEVQGLLADSAKAAAAADRLSTTVSQLSSLLTSGPSPEQEALFSRLQAGERSLLQLMAGARNTMGSANELATTAELLAARFNIGEPGTRPFDIADYRATALQLEGTAKEFRRMIVSLNELVASPLMAEQLPDLVLRAEAVGARALRNTVWLVAGSAVVSFCAMLAALLAYRVLVGRLTSRGN